MNDGMVDVSGFVADPVLGYGVRGRHMIYNYKSKYFGVCDMCVELVEPEPYRSHLSIWLGFVRVMRGGAVKHYGLKCSVKSNC
jgi:hypothetical protein